ncbi:MAG: hypothetical protein DSM106950_25465 [Stigonema ocellatum SAG 48.90 = DSM 106950]|nr:hypothetical protein [Stigonema ocellatum SAG 48.90 = DSM 106950]
MTLVAHHLQSSQKFSLRQAAWYAKPLPTFAFGDRSCPSVSMVLYFFNVALRYRYGKNPSCFVGTFDRYLGLRRLNG